jgi:hypothetical protein
MHRIFAPASLRLLLALFFVLSVLVASESPAFAGPPDDVVDITCRSHAYGPAVTADGYQVEATAGYNCSHPHIDWVITACLNLNGVPMDCGVTTDGSDVHLLAPCLPGLWTVEGLGLSEAALPAATYGETLILPQQCRILSPGQPPADPIH